MMDGSWLRYGVLPGMSQADLVFWERSDYPLQRDPSGFAPASGYEDLDMPYAPVEVPEFARTIANYPVFDTHRQQHNEQDLREFVRSRSAEATTNLADDSVEKGQRPPLYRPLPQHWIRIFVLDAGGRSDELRGRLETVSVEFQHTAWERMDESLEFKQTTDFAISIQRSVKVPYTALSYCWGSSERTHKVAISGHEVCITQTVDTILRHLRQPDHSINLWIDQICIDQDSLQDKDAQVARMGMIYKRARNTIIWLGEEPEKGAFRVMQGLHEATYGRERDLLEEEVDYLRAPLNEDPVAFQTLKDMFQRPWFQRTWIVQEAVLSRQLYFMTGPDTITWEDFAGYCVSIEGIDIFGPWSGEPAIDSPPARSGLTILQQLYGSRGYHQTHQAGATMLHWMVDTRYAAVTNPLDKVFGILGMCSNPIVPSYSRTKRDLFIEVTLMALREAIENFEKRRNTDEDLMVVAHGRSKVLSCVDHEAGEGPSWTPDWSQPRYTTALAYDTSSLGVYQAGAETREQIFTIREGGLVIDALTIFATSIDTLSDVFYEAELTAEHSSKANLSLRKSIEFVKSCASTSKQTPTFESICATFVVGKDGDWRLKYPDEYIEIISLLCDSTTGKCPSLPGQTYTPRQQKGHFKLEHLSRRQPGRTFQNLKRAYRKAMLNRRLCWTSKGLGLVPRFAKDGDDIVIFPGQPVPFVLRRQCEGEYRLVGECYVHDLMDGTFATNAAGSARWIGIV